MKKNQYKELYLEALCDRKVVNTETLKSDYDNFQKRLNEARNNN